MSTPPTKPARPRRKTRGRRRPQNQAAEAQANGAAPKTPTEEGGDSRDSRNNPRRRRRSGGPGSARSGGVKASGTPPTGNPSPGGSREGSREGGRESGRDGGRPPARRKRRSEGSGGKSNSQQGASSNGRSRDEAQGKPRGGKRGAAPDSNRKRNPRNRRGGNAAAGPVAPARRRRGKAAVNPTQRLKTVFEKLHATTSIDPEERWNLSRDDGSLTPRVIDLIAPLGKGQRCLIVAPPKAGKTTLLLEIAKSLEINHPEAEVFALLVDERPEEVTHFMRTCHAEVIAASSDQVAKDHVKIAEEGILRVLEPVMEGKDVVLLLDSITRLARAYNVVKGDSGRTLSGGMDAKGMQFPRQLFGAARNIEHGGSLTILGTALVDTGSRMDEVIFQEFKGTGNTEIVLSRALFEKRIFPAVDIAKSGTRKEEKLYDPEQIDLIFKVRRVLASMAPDRAMDGLLKLMAKHPSNDSLLKALPTTTGR